MFFPERVPSMILPYKKHNVDHFFSQSWCLSLSVACLLALSYCDLVYESELHQHSSRTYSSNIYLTLLQIYLQTLASANTSIPKFRDSLDLKMVFKHLARIRILYFLHCLSF